MTLRGRSPPKAAGLSSWDLLSTRAPEIQDTPTRSVEESSRRQPRNGIVRESLSLSLHAVTAGYPVLRAPSGHGLPAMRPPLIEVDLGLHAGELVCVLGP